MASINTDIYKINEFVDDIKKKFIEVENEETEVDTASEETEKDSD